MAEAYVEIPMVALAGPSSAPDGENLYHSPLLPMTEEDDCKISTSTSVMSFFSVSSSMGGRIEYEYEPADPIDILDDICIHSGERIQYEKGAADLIDHILKQIWNDPGITETNGCIRFPGNPDLPEEFHISGLLNIRRNSDKVIEEFKNDRVVEIICPVIIPGLQIEFTNSLTFCGIRICERAWLIPSKTTAELELYVFHGQIALGFVRILSIEDFEIDHEASLNAFSQCILRRKLFALQREQECKIKETIAYFISRMVNKILRIYAMDEKIQLRCSEDDS